MKEKSVKIYDFHITGTENERGNLVFESNVNVCGGHDNAGMFLANIKRILDKEIEKFGKDEFDLCKVMFEYMYLQQQERSKKCMM